MYNNAVLLSFSGMRFKDTANSVRLNLALSLEKPKKRAHLEILLCVNNRPPISVFSRL